MATGTTTPTINAKGQIQVQCVLATGSWGTVEIDVTKALAILVASGGAAERTVAAILGDPISGPTKSTTTNADDTATVVFPATGDAYDRPEHCDVHTGEAVELAGALAAGLFSDGTNESGEVADETSLTNNADYAMPVPIAMWAFAPKQIYTDGVGPIRVSAGSRYGIASVSVEISDGSNTFSKQVTARTTVELDTPNYPTNKCDLYVINFTAAELSSNSIADGECDLTFTVTDKLGNTLVSDATGTGQKRPKAWPIYNDQADAYGSALPVAYVDQRETVTTGALSGGSVISKGDRIEAAGTVGNTVIGIVTEDYNGSGTLTFARVNPQIDTIGHIADTETITAYDAGTSDATGVTCVATADSAYVVAHGSGAGTLNDPDDPYSSLGWAARAVTLANDAAGRGRMAAGTYYFKTPFTTIGNDDFMFDGSVVAPKSWLEFRIAPGFTTDDVFYMGTGGQNSHYYSGAWVHFAGEWKFHNPYASVTNFLIVPYCWIDDVTVTGGSYTRLLHNTNGVFIYKGIDVPPLSNSMRNTAGTEYGAVIYGATRIGEAGSSDHTDTWQFNANYNGCFLNTRLDQMQGSAAGEHYDTVQTTASPSGNIIFQNMIDTQNRYQHVFLSGGVDAGMAFLNVLAEVADDGDVGSVPFAFGNSGATPMEHVVIAHFTHWTGDAARTGSLAFGSPARNCAIRNGSIKGIQSSAGADFLPDPRSGVQNIHMLNGTALGVRGTAGETLADLFADPGNGGSSYPSTAAADGAGYKAKAGGELTGRLLARDDVDGLLTDAFGATIVYDGTGAVGAGQAEAGGGGGGAGSNAGNALQINSAWNRVVRRSGRHWPCALGGCR